MYPISPSQTESKALILWKMSRRHFLSKGPVSHHLSGNIGTRLLLKWWTKTTVSFFLFKLKITSQSDGTIDVLALGRLFVYDPTACEKFIGHGEIILQTKEHYVFIERLRGRRQVRDLEFYGTYDANGENGRFRGRQAWLPELRRRQLGRDYVQWVRRLDAPTWKGSKMLPIF